MKKLFTLSAATAFLFTSAIAQNQENSVEKEEVKTEVTAPTFFVKTPPLREIFKKVSPIKDPDTYYANWEVKDRKHEQVDWNDISDHGIPSNGGQDPALQSVQGTKDGSNTLKANWQALSGANPPDPTGAAGIDHYVQAVNSSYRVYNKDGSAASGSYPLSSLWSGFSSKGDPIVMYDRYADRWFISQFHYSGTITPQAPYHVLVAVSETSDPLGSYYAYSWQTSTFPDYPKYSVWSNAYFLTLNTTGADCIALERDKMLTGDPNAQMISMYFPSMYQFFNSVAPAYAEGLWAPEGDEPGWAFAVQDDSWSGISADHIKILKITLDWVTPANSDVVIHQELNTAAFNTVFTNNWDDITQPGTSQKLDAVTGIFMYRAQYRRFPGYDVIMLCHTVDVNNANRAGVRWYELRKDDGSDQWYVHQESTYDPNDGASRWMGNIGMDLNGNIGMAYSFVGPTDYPGLRYTGRFIDDPINTMTVEEQIAVEGGASKTSGGNRYGDYSQITVDPTDDATFWFTGEFIDATGSHRTQIFSFAMWEVTGMEEEEFKTPYFNSYQPDPYHVNVMWKNLKDDKIDITLYDMSGKVIAKEIDVDATTGQQTFDVPNSASGIYIVALEGANTKMSDKIYLSK
ncbi:T9SS type A sorting domain-containing protein [Paracrocinitomix mangrovi]|uniref:T9SS type A sorting domain-containing protein n=1 Tax=Paracrocinitomix mangrovi TaxID=2862509 RepID=UPI001C8D7E9C|nr:T9SS type A sorting domain-containing protein [Paracrocinitomix mangrovi]UKN03198.1 T9SS type A sorting domain-containing protein [Paracrocinitomix mangrovi]